MISNAYYKLFSIQNFTIIFQLSAIAIVYFIIRYIKLKNYIFLIDDAIIYLINFICIIVLLVRCIYIYNFITQIKKTLYDIENDLIKLVTIYTISHINYNVIDDIDDIDDRQDIVVHTNNNTNNHVIDNNYHIKLITEFKNLLLFYFSYFIYTLLNNSLNYRYIYIYNNLFNNSLKVYDTFLFNKLSYNYYQINNDYTKLHFCNIYIKSLLHNDYNDTYISSTDYKKCNDLIDNLNSNMYKIYLFIFSISNAKHKYNEHMHKSKLDIYNIQLYGIIKIFSIILIIISIFLLIIYYINYLSDISIFYIILISLIYICTNLYCNQIYNCINFDYTIENYSNDINMYDYINNIQNEINTIILFSLNKINIIYK